MPFQQGNITTTTTFVVVVEAAPRTGYSLSYLLRPLLGVQETLCGQTENNASFLPQRAVYGPLLSPGEGEEKYLFFSGML